jgi:hypothetical protein
MEAQDTAQVKEVMRNVREGFGRNRRAFSSGLNQGEARGRFNLDALVAADGSKDEAARLGLLESDEEEAAGRDPNGKHDDSRENDEDEDEDEEARMERELRERYLDQPQVYITSDESSSEDSEDEKHDNGQNQDDLVDDDEAREARQMKLFSAKAKINRRMQVGVVCANEGSCACLCGGGWECHIYVCVLHESAAWGMMSPSQGMSQRQDIVVSSG